MKEKTIFQGRIFDVVQKEMVINDRPALRDIVVHNGGVALSCVRDGKILLVSQSRAAVNQKTLEIPAGTREGHEDPRHCGLRELNEETGYTCQSMELITAFWPTPGYDTEVIYIYNCHNVTKAPARLAMDDTEDIEIVWMDLEEAGRKIASQEIRDGKTIIAVYYALLQERKNLT